MAVLTQTLAQQLAERYWASQAATGGVADAVRRRVWRRLRRLVLNVSDPAVQYPFDAAALSLPLSHEWPEILASHPDYGTNLTRLGQCIFEAYPRLTAVDVGANIGDSVAVLRSGAEFPILCVEGHPKFAAILEQNARLFPAVEIVCAYVSSVAGDRWVDVVEERGTSRFTGAGSNIVTMKTLDQILDDHPRFSRPKLVKIDTDGHDLQVIQGSMRMITESNPVLFFEFDPHSYDEHARATVLGRLAKAGYGPLLVWVNTGEYLVSLEVDDTAQLRDLTSYCLSEPTRYLDCAAFHEADREIARTARERELRYFTPD